MNSVDTQKKRAENKHNDKKTAETTKQMSKSAWSWRYFVHSWLWDGVYAGDSENRLWASLYRLQTSSTRATCFRNSCCRFLKFSLHVFEIHAAGIRISRSGYFDFPLRVLAIHAASVSNSCSECQQFMQRVLAIHAASVSNSCSEFFFYALHVYFKRAGLVVRG